MGYVHRAADVIVDLGLHITGEHGTGSSDMPDLAISSADSFRTPYSVLSEV